MQQSQSSIQYVISYQGRYYPFNKAQIVIGSDPHCDIPIANNPHILPAHAWLTLFEGRVFLQHQNSNAVIWVNGMRVTEVELQDRAEIAVGDPETKLTLLLNPMSTGQIGAGYSQVSSNQGWQAAQSVAPPAVAATDTTRYLCAAGHLSEGFQDYVTRHVIHEHHRAIGETYGVDMRAVVSWCKSGIKRITIRDTVLLGILLLIFLFVVINVGQLVGATISPPSQYGGYNPVASFSSLIALGVVLQLFVTLIVVYLIERAIKHFWPKTHPGFLSLFVLLLILVSGGTNFLLACLLVLALPGTVFVELIIRFYGEATQRLSKGQFEKNLMPMPLDAELVSRLNESFTSEQRNVVAYSGRRPFVGAGYYLDGWSFVVDTTKGAQSQLLQSEPDEPLSFTLSELYGTVRQALEGQGLNDVLEIEEKLYVNGQRLLENPSFFDATALRPVSRVDRRWVEEFKERPTEDVRYYQCIRFTAWRGEVIFTAFLRFVRRGKNLFAEIDYLLLPPLMPIYHWVDEKEITPAVSKIWELFKLSFDSPIRLCFGVPGRFLRDSIYRFQQQRLARIAQNNPSFDYGATSSLRWVASDDDYHLFFQGLDKEMYLKIAQQELLEAIVVFLDEHHIDTTELRQRQQTILNEGTIVSGGELNISGENVQLGAKSSIKNVSNSRTAAGSQAKTPAKPSV